MRFQLIDRIAVEEDGEGPAIVCVHGLGGSSNTFTPLMPAMARHRVIRLDLPGSGRSQRAEGGLTIERYVATTLDICDRLNVQRAHWVGHSMGNIVLQHIAAAHPKRVASLSMFGPLITPPDAARTAILARAAKAREGASGIQDIAQALLQASISADTRERLPIAVAFVRESLMRQEGENYARSCEALAAAQPAAVENIEAPVLLVTGDEDGVASPQAVRAMADRLHRAASKRVVVLPRCGHWTPIERPEECARELRDFLASNARS
jgi:pimeloyl-ACP methyl ester carboxylesterase